MSRIITDTVSVDEDLISLESRDSHEIFGDIISLDYNDKQVQAIEDL